MQEVTIMSPQIQFGFAAFAFMIFGVLASVLVWLAKALLKELRSRSDSDERNVKQMSDVVVNNTVAMQTVGATSTENKQLAVEIKDLLLQRPCMSVAAHRNGESKKPLGA
jgi:hypothetical protein